MISDDAMLEKYPLDDVQKSIVRSPSIMKMMMEPGDSAGDTDFGVILNGMAKNDASISGQMAEAYLKGCSKGTVSSLKSLQKIEKFL